MPIPLTPEELESFTSGQLHGQDPYEDRLGNGTFVTVPHCMYFIHVGLDSANVEDVKHYYHDDGSNPILYNDTEALVKKLADNASLKDYVPPQHGAAFLDMVWRRKSYFAFVIDHPLYVVWPDKGIEFNNKGGGLPNHTFFDAKDFSVFVRRLDGTTVQRTAFLCINHMKDAAGGDLADGAKEFFSFSLLLKFGNFPEPVKYDPGGTNQGPPELP